VQPLTIRAAVEPDLARLTEIYNHYVRTTAVTFDLEPFAPDARRAWFGHYAATGRHRLLVAVEDETLVGYATSSPWRPKAAYATTVETSVYCAADAIGRGIGSRLYARLFELLAGEDVHRAVAGIALPNDASVRLHERSGFRAVGVFTEAGRKFERYWDVLWMERAFAPAAPER
jgi:phosphinothricin acetyltransferase